MRVALAPSLQGSFAQWWRARPGSSQRRLRWASVVVASVAAALAIAQPLVRSADATRASLSRDAIALTEARAQAAEIAALARSAEPAAGDAKADLDRVLAQSDLRTAVTQLDWQNGRARLTFAAVAIEPLIAALEALQRGARLRVVDARLTARVEPGTVRAELTLSR